MNAKEHRPFEWLLPADKKYDAKTNGFLTLGFLAQAGGGLAD